MSSSVHTLLNTKVTFLSPSLEPGIAGKIIERFLGDEVMHKVPTDDSSEPDKGWVQVGTSPRWEHTEWLSKETFNECLRNKVLYEWDSSHYEDTPDIQADKCTRELICRKAPFIALVNSKEEFQRLLNHQKFLEQIAPFLQNEQRTDVI